MVTCGGQATIPIVAAVSAVDPVPYAEIVASIASRSAGPGTRANIDEFTETTAQALEAIGGAERGKAIIILNPAEPPMIMRDTVFCAIAAGRRPRRDHASRSSRWSTEVAELRPRLPAAPRPAVRRADRGGTATPGSRCCSRSRGAATTCPPYAGNLDIMTAAAVAVGELLGRAQRARPGWPA